MSPDNGAWVVVSSKGKVLERFGGSEWGLLAATMRLASFPGCHVERR
jgi:hypothetical protein